MAEQEQPEPFGDQSPERCDETQSAHAGRGASPGRVARPARTPKRPSACWPVRASLGGGRALFPVRPGVVCSGVRRPEIERSSLVDRPEAFGSLCRLDIHHGLVVRGVKLPVRSCTPARSVVQIEARAPAQLREHRCGLVRGQEWERSGVVPSLGIASPERHRRRPRARPKSFETREGAAQPQFGFSAALPSRDRRQADRVLGDVRWGTPTRGCSQASSRRRLPPTRTFVFRNSSPLPFAASADRGNTTPIRPPSGDTRSQKRHTNAL